MPTQTVAIKFNGRSGKLDIKTEGFVGEACTEITHAVKSQLQGEITQEAKTPEAFLEPPCVSEKGTQTITG